MYLIAFHKSLFNRLAKYATLLERLETQTRALGAIRYAPGNYPGLWNELTIRWSAF